MIYVLEDDTSIRQLVVYTLESAGCQARGFENASAFWKGLREGMPSLLLLDVMLPDEDGLAVLKKLRSAPQTAKLPVIMLTAKGSEYDKVLGLDMGADDYLPKPFGLMELVARVKRLLRRAEADEKRDQDEYRVGGLYVSLRQHMACVDGEPLPLTLKEFETLACLLKNQDRALTRDQIMTSVWGYDYDGESRTVDVHIRTLRQKLGRCEDLIETVRGVGYRIGGRT